MVKIKILNPNKGRNEPTFRYFKYTQNLFKKLGIEFTESNNYDLVFIGMEDFIYRKLPLSESVEKGIRNIKEYGDRALLFDGSDSTSLLGSFEVLAGSNAKFLFKNQLLKNKEDYNIQSPFNKIFFKGSSELTKGYKISSKDWNRIKLSGYNLGSILPSFIQFQPVSVNKVHDIWTSGMIPILCMIFDD